MPKEFQRPAPRLLLSPAQVAEGQADIHANRGRAVLAAGKSAGGFLALVSGAVAGIQMIIAAAGLVLH